MYDVAIVGGGIAGMATAARLQAQGLRTIVFEAHGQPGGCAGFYRRHGFAFDVGATTLVDFEPGGVGGELFTAIGMEPPPSEALPGYVAWLPDRTITLHRDPVAWTRERLQTLGDTPRHRRLWDLLDRLAQVFWNASRHGIRLPLRSPTDLWRAVQAVGLLNLPLVRYLHWTVADALRAHGLCDDRPLTALLGMLLEDTVHAPIEEAPLINGALGITIRGAGLTRATGGMYGFWQQFLAHYRRVGGCLRVGCPVQRIERLHAGFRVHTRHGTHEVPQVVSALPAGLTARLAPSEIARSLRPYLDRDEKSLGGALVLFLGVPEHEVADQPLTHHQILHDYHAPQGNGNNLFLSVSAPGDILSAPPGHRAVMISTHCALEDWEGLSPADYAARKAHLNEHLLTLARRVYSDLGRHAVVHEMGTPHTYARFTHRPRGAVGGVHQNLANSNQNAIPHTLGLRGFWLVGDSTWPGLGTVACVLGSRIVAEGVRTLAHRLPSNRTSEANRAPLAAIRRTVTSAVRTGHRPAPDHPSSADPGL